MTSIPTCADKLPAIKVCGMRDPANIAAIAALHPDMMGFIFWSKSKRAACGLNPDALDTIPASIIRVGVFVNATIDEILSTARSYKLRLIQLHGDESPAFCRIIRSTGLRVAKAIGIATENDIDLTDQYQGNVDLLVLDTKSPLRGGTGTAYDRSLLAHYNGQVPFLMSGGIAPGDADAILHLNLPQMAGVDINSRFEIEPGIKDTAEVAKFIQQVRKISI